ncbi:MAG: MogA/MoaB family molybdenum cofactor biosynthesis protein [Clostridiaceae bacterium]|nr:MogA/MoaB family molybdenum cofactor biosynthesis protein [Clostridiaceae bacterium]
MYKIAVVTISDKGAAGLREDKSGPLLAEALAEVGTVAYMSIVPDERAEISAEIIRLSDDGADLIMTSGGTGLSPRDITPEATLDIADRVVPGLAEAMRAGSMKFTNRAMLSRGTAAIRGSCLIINLPGSPKAAIECLDIIKPVLPHALDILTANASECARK